jgi:uncharacterized protein (DUF1778 family)
MAAPAVRQRGRRDTPSRERRDSVVNVRMARQTRELIDEAAEAVGKTRSEFMVESARTHAIDVLLDKRLFSLGTEQYDAFLKALDAPPAPNEKLKRLLKSKSPWER